MDKLFAHNLPKPVSISVLDNSTHGILQKVQVFESLLIQDSNPIGKTKKKKTPHQNKQKTPTNHPTATHLFAGS